MSDTKTDQVPTGTIHVVAHFKPVRPMVRAYFYRMDAGASEGDRLLNFEHALAFAMKRTRDEMEIRSSPGFIWGGDVQPEDDVFAQELAAVGIEQLAQRDAFVGLHAVDANGRAEHDRKVFDPRVYPDTLGEYLEELLTPEQRASCRDEEVLDTLDLNYSTIYARYRNDVWSLVLDSEAGGWPELLHFNRDIDSHDEFCRRMVRRAVDWLAYAKWTPTEEGGNDHV